MLTMLDAVPVYVPATVLTFVVSVIAGKYKLGGPIALLCLPVAMIGTCSWKMRTGH